MRKIIITAAVPVLIGLTAPAVAIAGAAPAGAATCNPTGQNIRTTHTSRTTTVTIITRQCGESYRSWAVFADGHNVKGPWRTANPSISYDAVGGNFEGGYQKERTGGGTISTHRSY